MPMGIAVRPLYIFWMIAKVQKRWSVILGIIMGIICSLPECTLFRGYIGMGIIADLVAGAGDYRNKAANLLSYMLMSLSAAFTPMWCFLLIRKAGPVQCWKTARNSPILTQ